MYSISNFQVLLPIGLLVLQTFILLFITVAILKKIKILKLPYAGMEYSSLIVTSAFLFAIFFISTGDIEGVFQAFKTFQNAKENLFNNTFLKFSQFFLVILFFIILFWLISFFLVKLLFGFKNSIKEIEEGNVPASVLIAVVILSFAMVMQFSAKEIIEYITPQYLNFK